VVGTQPLPIHNIARSDIMKVKVSQPHMKQLGRKGLISRN